MAQISGLGYISTSEGEPFEDEIEFAVHLNGVNGNSCSGGKYIRRGSSRIIIELGVSKSDSYVVRDYLKSDFEYFGKKLVEYLMETGLKDVIGSGLKRKAEAGNEYAKKINIGDINSWSVYVAPI